MQAIVICLNLYICFTTGTLWKNHHFSRTGKWGVAKKDWGPPTFAKVVCPGSGYLITGDAVPKMRDAISKVL